MKSNVILLVGFMALLSLTASAQNGAPVTISLRQAIEVALSDNPTIQIADLEVDRQDYVRKETWGNLLPQLSSSVSYNNALKKATMEFNGQKVSFEPDNTVAFGASLNLPLVVPGVYQTLKLNREQMRSALESARGSRIVMVSEVKKAFYNILRIDEEILVLKASQTNVQETVDQLRVKTANGLASEYDLLTAEVQLSNLEPTIIQAEKGRLVAHMYLKMLMGLPLEQDIMLEGDLKQLEKAFVSDLTLYNTDLTENSDLKQLGIQEDILARQLKVMRTQRMPTLGASLSGQYLGRNPISMGGAAPTQNFEWQNSMSLGASLSIPLFAGMTNVNREKQLKNNLSQLKLQRTYAEQQMEVQVNTAISNVMTARERMTATTKTVLQAQKAYEISNVRFNAGAGTILELNSAELQLTQSQLNHSQAVYDLLSAQADYDQIIGKEE